MSLITTDALTRSFGSVTAVSDLTLAIEPGIVGLVGANGAGKSTLIKVLLGLLAPSSGDATVLGRSVSTDGSEIRSLVGYMPEHDCLPPDVSATELVVHLARMSGLTRTAARERTADTLRHVGLHEERYRRIGGYSTGMRQRVKLAQALVHDPKLVLLDEPTNGLDPAGRDDMLDLIGRIGHEYDISVLVTSHLLGELERICDHVVVIDGGRLLRSTATTDVTAASQVLQLEVDDGMDDVQRRLDAAGLTVRRSGRHLEVDLRDVTTYDQVRDQVVAADVGLLRLEQQRHRMSEIFTVPSPPPADPPTGADPAGADPAGADPTGADPAGADPTGAAGPTTETVSEGGGEDAH